MTRINLTEARANLDRAVECAINADFQSALNIVTDTREQWNEQEDIPFAVRLRLEEATFAILAGYPLQALTHLNWALGQARSKHSGALDDPATRYRFADCHTRYVDGCLATGAIHVSELADLLDDATAILEPFGEPGLLVPIQSAWAKVRQFEGRPDDAIMFLKRGLQLAELAKVDDSGLLRHLARVQSDDNRFDEAIPLLQKLLKRDLSVVNKLGCLTQLGHAGLKTGNQEVVADSVRKAELLEQSVSTNQACAIWGLQVEYYRSVGQSNFALVAAEKMERASMTLSSPTIRFNALLDLIDVHSDLKNLTAVDRFIQEATTLATSLDSVTNGTRLADKLVPREARLTGLKTTNE